MPLKHLTTERVLEALSDAVIVIDHVGTILLWNPACERMLGYRAADRLGSKLSLIIPDRFAHAHVSGLERFSQSGQSRLQGRPVEVFARHQNGKEIPIELTITAFDGPDGLLFMGVLRDITARRQREQAMREAEERFALLAQQTQDVITYADADGAITYVSPAIRSRLGYEPSDWIGQRVGVYYHPDDRASMRSLSDRVRGGEDVDRFVCRVRHREGHYLWLDTTMRVLRDQAGQVLQVVGIGRDITEHRKLTEQLGQAVRMAGLGHFEWDITTDRIDWSDVMYEICGVPKDTVLTSEVMRDLIHPDEVQQATQAMRKCLATGLPYEDERRIVRPDGAVRYLVFQGEVVRHEGRPARLVGTARDITERRQVERLLFESEKFAAIGHLAAGIAHEIRNPMTVIKGFAQLLQPEMSADHQRFVGVILRELERIDGVVNELLMLAKPQATSLSTIDISAVLYEVIEFLSPECSKASVELVVDPLEGGLIAGEENQIKQVFINLLLNAIESMPHGGHVYISYQEIEGQILIRFRDEGVGVDADRLEKLGEPFYTTKERGTGLGLMVCRKIMELHQGRLQFDSQPGRGMTVSVWLPAKQREAAGSARELALSYE